MRGAAKVVVEAEPLLPGLRCHRQTLDQRRQLKSQSLAHIWQRASAHRQQYLCGSL